MSPVVSPAAEPEIGEVVREARAKSASLEIRGGGTRLTLGRPVHADMTLTLDGMTKTTLYEPGALSVVVQAGARLSDVEQTLAAEGQRLPFEPMDHRGLLGSSGEPTIGAVVACGVSGPRRVQSGACRDSLLGVRFVDGRGDVLKNGGRVMKNVTGYDLAKLMCGAFGTLGVLTEVSFKLSPTPERSGTLAIRDVTIEQAVAAMSAALGSPFEVAGAAYLPDADGGAAAFLRIEGFQAQFAYRRERLRALIHERLAREASLDLLEGAAHDALWRDIRDVKPLWAHDGVVWRISLKPSDAAAVAQEIARGLEAEGDVALMLDCGGGLIWLGAPCAEDACASVVRRVVGAHGGHATLVRAATATRASTAVFHPEPPRLASLARDLRAAFDPSGVLNPGRVAAHEV